MEKNIQQTSTTKNPNRTKLLDNGPEISSTNDHHYRRQPHRHHHHHHHHHRHHHQRHHHHRSYSSCSTCSDRSHKDFHSDIDYHHHHSEPVQKIITPRPYKTRTLSPPKRNIAIYRDTGIGTGLETRIMKDSSITANLEDVPNVRDNRLEQIPVVRRTIIVEPYPAEPSSQIIIKPRTDMIGKIRLGTNQNLSGGDETIVYPSTAFMSKKSKKKKKITENIDTNIGDLILEDVNNDDNETTKSKKKTTNKKSSTKMNVKNAFYN